MAMLNNQMYNWNYDGLWIVHSLYKWDVFFVFVASYTWPRARNVMFDPLVMCFGHGSINMEAMAYLVRRYLNSGCSIRNKQEYNADA